MAGEGIFPKVNGDVLYATDANSFGRISQIINNGAMSDFGSTTFFDNISSDNAATKTGLTFRALGTLAPMGEYAGHVAGAYVYESQSILFDSTINTAFPSVNVDIWTVFDECDDSSLDTGLWTNSSCTEGTDGISGAAGGAKTITSNDLSALGEVFRVAFTMDGTTENAKTVTLLVTDTSETDTVLTISNNNRIYEGIATFYLDWAGDTVYVVCDYYIQQDTTPDLDKATRIREVKTIDLTAYSAFQIRMTHNGGAGDAGINFFLRYLRVGNTNPSTTLTTSMSANAGSAYTAGENGQICKLGTTGTSLRTKIAGTVSDGEVVSITKLAMGKLT